MLKILRNKKTAKKVWIVLAIIIVPAFVLWGSGSLTGNKQEDAYAGKLFGRNIPLLEFKDSMDAVRNQAVIQFGDKFSEVQKVLNIEYRAWERLILLHEAKKRKIKATDEEVRETIASYPFFQRNGKFDDRQYNELLQYVFRAPPRLFEEQTRQNLVLSKLYGQVTKNVTLDDSQIAEEYRKLNEDISVYYIGAAPAEFAKGINPEEKDARDYFAKNSLEFKQPLSFSMDYIATDSETKIEEIGLRLNKRVDFIKAAQGTGLEVKETGLFGQIDPIPGIGWSPEILNLISKLKIGQYTPPIHLDKYYYILRLKEIKEPYIPDFKNIENKVKEAFIKDRSEKIAEAKIKECLVKLKELSKINPPGLDFTKIAKDYELRSGSTALFKYGSYIEGIGASDILWAAADELKEGSFSGIIRMSSGFYIIKLKERLPVDQNKFTAEKAEFSQNLLLQKKQELFLKFSEDLKRKAQ